MGKSFIPNKTPVPVSKSSPDDSDPEKEELEAELSWQESIKRGTVLAAPHLAQTAFRVFLGTTLALYLLNQSHLLPKSLSAVVSKTLFWPTLPITASRRIGKWATRIDDTVVMGGAPFGFLQYPEHLYKEHGVRAVVNLCEEYQGPLKKYRELGMEHLYLPTTDHFEPSIEDLMSAVSFIQRHGAHGNTVYVHCRAGHGRSAAAVFAWLMYKNPSKDLETLNRELRSVRNVRRGLWQQPNIQKLHARFQEKGKVLLDLEDTEDPKRAPTEAITTANNTVTSDGLDLGCPANENKTET